jgi:Protein of unknown function (DUF3224)
VLVERRLGAAFSAARSRVRDAQPRIREEVSMPTATGTFEVKHWNEAPYEEREDGAKLTRAEVEQSFSGDVAGEGLAQWLMSYRKDGTARFVGLQRVTGVIGDRRGAFVLETVGDFDGAEARWTATVIPGSGSADLEDLSGSGSFRAPHGSTAEFQLEYELG